ncbi:MAG TPA: hypothetical protein VFP55_05630 [Solirubrobacteraceae bacterium]|nr:hypothetical protein [Solirubrobacteraceae bacterium]
MSGWRISCGAALTGLAVAACGGGGGSSQSAGSPSGRFPVVAQASFPTSQRLSQHTDLVIDIRNAGSKPIPNIAVTILNPADGTAAAAFGMLLPQSQAGQPTLASRSRAVWVVDRAPGPCGYSCRHGGPGGAVAAYSNTWAMGKLLPGHTARFEWGVTAVQAGTYVIKYEVAAGLDGKARAVFANGGGPVVGEIRVTISSRPRQAYVNNNGQIVYTNKGNQP